MSLTVGTFPLLGAVAALILWRAWRGGPQQRVFWTLQVFFWLLLLLMHRWTLPLWERMPLLNYLQFSWRLLLFATFAGALLVGFVLEALRARPDALRTLGLAWVLWPIAHQTLSWLGEPRPVSYIGVQLLFVSATACVLLALWLRRGWDPAFTWFVAVVAVWGAALPLTLLPVQRALLSGPKYLRLTEQSLRPEVMRRQMLLADCNVAMMPKAVVEIPKEAPDTAAEVIAGEAEITQLDASGYRVSFDVLGRGTSRVAVNRFSFPGWTTRMDGRPVTTEVDVHGRIVLLVPAGRHSVTVRWGRTPLRRVADTISLLALLAALSLGGSLASDRLASGACQLFRRGPRMSAPS
jgi:hypothetical protein